MIASRENHPDVIKVITFIKEFLRLFTLFGPSLISHRLQRKPVDIWT